MFKPTFGQPATSSGFGTFGQAQPAQTSMFGKPATTGFGQPAFGAAAPSTGLFGNTMQQPTSLFGATTAPTFGQAATTQNTFGFGAQTTQPTTNLFGATQQSTGTGLFGAGASTFGQAKPAFGSTFGAQPTTGLFGAQQPAQAAPSLFGSTTNAITPFGGSAFGATAAAQPGTVIKFNPPTGSDTLQKGTNSTTITTRHMCISAMKEYEAKSLEELRYEDYAANRKGPQPGMFGQTAAQPGMFGATGTTGTMFGAQPTENKGLFGTTTNTLGGGFGATTGTGVFGAQPATATSLFGAKPTGFGATTTTTTTGFGGFGTPASTGGGLFGSTAPAFGATTTTSLFGQTSTAQPTTGFGTTTGFGGGFGAQPAQTTGLFGQAKPATTFGLGATAAPATGFGFGQTSTASTGLFGAKPTTTFGSAFGAPATSTFGAPTTSTSLFNKPATSAFSFGNNTGLGGTALNTGGSLFGAQQKPGGLFGSTPTTGLFGTTPSFGAATGTTGFGTTNTGLGGTSTFAAPSMFGSSMPAQPAPASFAPAPVHSAILALASNPFPDSPLYRGLLPHPKKTDPSTPQAMSNNALTQKAIQATKDLKVNTKADTRVRVKPLMPAQTRHSLFEGLDTPPPSECDYSSVGVRTLRLKPRGTSVESTQPARGRLNLSLGESPAERSPRLNESGGTERSESIGDALGDAVSNKENRRVSFSFPLETPQREPRQEEPFYIRKNPLFNPKPSNKNCESPQITLMEPAASSTVVEPPSRDTSIDDVTRNVISPACGVSSPAGKSPNDSRELDSTCLDETHGLFNEPSEYGDSWAGGHPSGIVLRRTDYYTIPSLAELVPLVGDDGSCVVDNFGVGRYGYGNIFYDCTMDVAGLDIDSIVHFRHKEVNVYPDDTNKPDVGCGLNRKCQVTLEQVFPVDKVSRELITDPKELKEMKYEDKLRRCTAKMNAHFVEYRPLTGSWVFRVDHFSKYGLSDSDDDEPMPPVKAKMPLVKQPPAMAKPLMPTAAAVKPTTPAAKMAPTAILSPISPPKQQCFSLTDPHIPSATFNVRDSTLDMSGDEIGSDDDVDDVMLDTSWGMPEAQIDPHRVQLMKSSLFHSNLQEEDFEELVRQQEFPARISKSSGALPLFTADSADVGGVPALPVMRPLPTPRPKTVSLKYSCNAIIPYGQSTMGALGPRNICDSGLMKGRSFRAGWSSFNRVSTLATRKQTENLAAGGLEGRGRGDMTSSLVQILHLYGGDSQSFRDSIERHLEIELRQATRGVEGGCPVLSATPGVTALNEHCLLARELAHDTPWAHYANQVWALCAALWGNLSALALHDEPYSHRATMMRKEALTEWLRSTATPQTDGDDHVAAAFAKLCSHDLFGACKLLTDKKDFNAAMLLTSGGALLQNQLAEWADVGADALMSESRIKLFALAAGLPVVHMSSSVNVCRGLDWVTVFALHYWYMCSPVASIADILAKYEAGFTGDEAYTEPPSPPYCPDVRTEQGRIILDLRFHLLKLYSSRSQPLEALLNPATHTSDPLDCRLSWLIGQTLSALGYNHVSPLCSSTLTVSFASQLEAAGLWHWAVFVLLHITDSPRRKHAVMDMIGRHAVPMNDRDLTIEEAFLVEELDVPAEWVYSAKATRALHARDHDDAAFYLLHAQDWNQAHQVIIDHIAPDLVINDRLSDLTELLSQLSEHGAQIAEWPQQGQLLLDFSETKRCVARALVDQDIGQLEAALPKLSSVCERVVRWPTHTAKHRLCQAEIAKGTGTVYLKVKSYYGTASSLRDARCVITRLPMPDDFVRELTEMVTQAERNLVKDVPMES